MNYRINKLLISARVLGILLCVALAALSAQAQMTDREGAGQVSRGSAQSSFPWSLMPGAHSAGGPTVMVYGSGTDGHLSKWAGGGTVLVDSSIVEDKFGKVTLASLLEAMGGIRFLDGSLQTTAAVTGLQSVNRDPTLAGNGTSGSPLGVAIPLVLRGAGPGEGVLTIVNTAARGGGVSVTAGDGGAGVIGVGGAGLSGAGGLGVLAMAGASSMQSGGTGIEARGGTSGPGIRGGTGIIAIGGIGADDATTGFAGVFVRDVQVTGNLFKSGGSFKIDHPLDPENKYLYHSFVESPDMKNIYDGTVTTDQNGDATIHLPDYFEVLNRDFRYQLTVIGAFAQAIVAEKIKDNQFRIKTSAPAVEVSWQVTGIRQDAYANKHRIPVEEAKPEAERGTYLHPESFDQREEKGVLLVQHPQLFERLKQKRERMQR